MPESLASTTNLNETQAQTIFDAAQPVSEEYEDKIKEYNKASAKIVRFISRLTPYLY